MKNFILKFLGMDPEEHVKECFKYFSYVEPNPKIWDYKTANRDAGNEKYKFIQKCADLTEVKLEYIDGEILYGDESSLRNGLLSMVHLTYMISGKRKNLKLFKNLVK